MSLKTPSLEAVFPCPVVGDAVEPAETSDKTSCKISNSEGFVSKNCGCCFRIGRASHALMHLVTVSWGAQRRTCPPGTVSWVWSLHHWYRSATVCTNNLKKIIIRLFLSEISNKSYHDNKKKIKWPFLMCDIFIAWEWISAKWGNTCTPSHRAGHIKPGAAFWNPSPYPQGESLHCSLGGTPCLAKGLQMPLQTGTATKPRHSQ